MIERRANRTYTLQEKTEAIGLALSIGPLKAAKQLGMPVRTVSAWTAGERSAGSLSPIVTATREQAADRLWQTLQAATDAVEAGLRDPRQRLGDRARALEVLVHAHELLAGHSTENVAVGIGTAPGGGLPKEEATSGLDWREELQLAQWIERQLAAHADPAAITEILVTPQPAGPLPELPRGTNDG